MREIKFRIWHKSERKFIDTKWLMFDENGFYMAELYGGKKIVKHEFELMQFTGLHDKNGKEIYESDLVNFNNLPVLFRVVCNEGCFDITDGHCEGTLRAMHKEIEVIGNIYENPKLLEVTP